MCSFVATLARPQPNSVAGTTRLIKVAQFLAKTMIIAISTGSIPKALVTLRTTGITP